MELPDWLREKRDKAQSLIKEGTDTCCLPRHVKWKSSRSRPKDGYLQIRKSKLPRRTTLNHPESPEQTEVVSSHHVILHPNETQRLLLISWLHTSQKMYNATRQAINELYGGPIYTHQHCPSLGGKKQELRNYMALDLKPAVVQASQEDVGKAFCRKETLDLAFDRCLSDYKAARSNLMAGHNRSGQFCFDHVQSEDKYWLKIAGRVFVKQGGIYPSVFGHLKALREVGGRRRPYDLASVTRDSTLVYRVATDTWDLYVPQETVLSDTHAGPDRTLAMDPGYRTLLTGYSDGHLLEVGDGVLELPKWHEEKKRLEKIGSRERLRNLRRQVRSCPSRRRRKVLRQRIRRMSKGHHRKAKLASHDRKLRCRIDDLHWKAIAYLTANYRHILLGDMNPVRIISRDGNLHRANKRRMVQLRYGTLVERLRFKCQCKGVSLTVVDESWTSVTCGRCAHVNPKSKSKTFSCARCRYTVDRDVNGARNIYLKSRC